MTPTRSAVSSYLCGLTLTALITIIYGVFCAPIALAQPSPNPLTPATMTGAPPYSTHEMVREDVALASGGLHVYIPILSLKGKGGQTFNLGWAHDSHGINLQGQ